MKFIVVINGKGGIGKDTLIKAIADSGKAIVYNVSSIDPIRDFSYQFNVNGKKDLSYRRMLSEWKKSIDTYYFEENGITYSNNYLKNYVDLLIQDGLSDDNNYILFVHIREPEKIDSFICMAKNRMQVLGEKDIIIKTLLVTSDRELADYGNDSDNGVYNYTYNYYFTSNGTIEEDNEAFVEFVCSELLERKRN